MAFRREMGLDSPLVAHKSERALLGGGIQVSGKASVEAVSTPVPVQTSPPEKSSHRMSRLFGRETPSAESLKQPRHSTDTLKQPRHSFTLFGLHGGERDSKADDEPARSPRHSIATLFHRNSSVQESSVPSVEEAKPSRTTLLRPSLSGDLPSLGSRLTASKEEFPISASPPSSRISFHAKKKGQDQGPKKSGSNLKQDVSGRKQMLDRRRSRSMHNFFIGEDEDEFMQFGLFGMTLEDLLAREEQRKEGVDFDFRVPSIMDYLLGKVERSGGFQSEGIFRISVATSTKKEAMRKIHLFVLDDNADGQREDPYLFCALLKEWLMRLPEPLINDYGACLSLATASSVETEHDILSKLWKDMSVPARAVVRRLMVFIKLAVAHEKETRMNVDSLCMVFVPSLLRPKKSLSALQMLTDQSAAQTALLKMYDFVNNKIENSK
jgi:hypothetical protein